MSSAGLVIYVLLCFAAACGLVMAMACAFLMVTEWFVERKKASALGFGLAALFYFAATLWLLILVIPAFLERIS